MQSHEHHQEESKTRKFKQKHAKNRAILAALIGLVTIFYLLAILRMGEFNL